MTKFNCKLLLSDCLLSQKGVKPQLLERDQFAGSVPYLDIYALEMGTVKNYTFKELGNIATKKDVLIVWDGSRCGLPFKGQPGAIGSTLMRLTPVEVDVEYLYYYLKSKFEIINKNPTGDSIPHVNPDLFYALELPYVGIKGQKAIVEELKNKLQQTTQFVEKHKNTIIETLKSVNVPFDNEPDIEQAFNNFRQAVFAKAFRGDLSKVWRDNEGKFNHPLIVNKTYFNTLGEFDIPITWQWLNLSDLATLSVGATPNRGVKSYWNGDVPWVSSGELNSDFINETRECITEEGLKSIGKKVLEPNTLLMAMVGEGKTRGKVGILNKGAITNQNICAISLKEDVDPLFILYYFQYKYKEIRGDSTTSRSNNSQTSLNSNTIGRFNICLPPYKEQKEIVKILNETFKISDKVVSDYYLAAKDLLSLEKAIISKAFDGTFDDDLDVKREVVATISMQKSILEEERKIIRREQLLFRQSHFMKNTLPNVLQQIKKVAIDDYSNSELTNEFKFELYEKVKSTIPDMDYDDFSIAFQELAQDRLNNGDQPPFFSSHSRDGKLYHKIDKNEITVS